MTVDALGRTALYRLYAASGPLLYVGITDNLSSRFAAHSREKSWWRDVDGKAIWFYDKRAEAEEAETAAIHGEDPVHNVACTPRHAEVILAAKRQAASKYDWPAIEPLTMYPRKCACCGRQVVATTDDPEVIVACHQCDEFYGGEEPVRKYLTDLQESA